MNATAPVTYFADADGIGWITFDDPTGRVNIFSSQPDYRDEKTARAEGSIVMKEKPKC